MISTLNALIIALVCAAGGVAVGFYLLPRWLRQGPGPAGESHRELHQVQDQHRSYRYEVNAHFNRTAELLGQLANTYRDVHNHLAEGSRTLCDPEAVRRLKPLPEDSRVLEEEHPAIVEPPRDYALRTPYEKGVLDEDFGLEKSPREQAIEPPRY